MTGIANKEKFIFGIAALFFMLVTALAVFTDSFYFIIAPFAALVFYAGWYQKAVFFWLLLAALPFSFEYQFSPSLGTDLPDELLMVLTSFFFLAAWLFRPSILPRRTLSHPLVLLLGVVITWLILSVCFSTNKLLSLKFLLAKGWYIGAFVLAPLVLFRERRNMINAVLVLATAVMLVTLIALVRHYNSGFSFISVNDAVNPFFRNHVSYSAMLVCLIPVLSAVFYLSGNKRIRFIAAVCIGITLMALFFSYARGAWLALLVGMVAAWLIKKKAMLAGYIIAVLLVIASLFWIKSNDRYLLYAHDYQTTIFHKDFGQHIVATYKLKDVSTAERFYRWVAGVRMIKDNWLTGYGPNTFYANYKSYTVPAYKTWVSDNSDRSTVHNYFLLTAIEQGLPGLLFLLILIGAMLGYAQYLYKRAEEPFDRTVALTTGVILSMILTVNFLSDLIETDKVGSLFFLCIAFLVATDMKTRSDPSPDIQRIP